MHYIDEGIDTGPVIDQIIFPIFEDDTAATLHARASEQIYPLFTRNIHRLVESPDRLPSLPQTGTAYTFRRGDVQHEIDLTAGADEVYDLVRALTFPGRPRPFARIGRHKIFLSIDEP
jgi:methionyl-tRNA formyltransferase